MPLAALPLAFELLCAEKVLLSTLSPARIACATVSRRVAIAAMEERAVEKSASLATV
jgi:hypothetical protein